MTPAAGHSGGVHNDRQIVSGASGDSSSSIRQVDKKSAACGCSGRKGRQSQIAGRRGGAFSRP